MARIWRFDEDEIVDALNDSETFALCQPDDAILTLRMAEVEWRRLNRVMRHSARFDYVVIWKKYVFPMSDADFMLGRKGFEKAFAEANASETIWKLK